jgi:predicted dehydrogenase
MKEHKIGIIMNGVTGRMGTNQHLLRSIAEIIKQGGVRIKPGETIMPDPILIGRDENKLQKLCAMSGVQKMSTDLDQVLADPYNVIYFDSQTTGRRAEAITKAVKAGKHIYCEKPIAVDTKQAMELYELCKNAGVKNGVVQDKLWLPGIIKLKRLSNKDSLVKYFR